MQRKLTTILSADVVGYSGLMQADENGTLERLKRNRGTIFDPQVAAHDGRLIKLMGDGALVEFASVVAAVACALAIQEATAAAEPQIDEARRIVYRIGVNLGDVIVDDDDLYGEGVNVAARLQTLAPVGGVALSRTVRDHVQGKAPWAFEDMGEHTVKAGERPVHVFLVRAADVAVTGDVQAEPPRKLSVCVLPFANMSGDAEQEYFSDGITEDIITDLSKVSALSVVSRNSAFTFKGKHVDLPRIARQLGVSHVLEGSVRKSGGRVRITAQLIDGVSNNHVWAERYDRDLSDIFALQDEISQAIVAALKLKLLPEERKAIEQRGTTDLEAYNLYLQARQSWLKANIAGRRDYQAVIRLCRRAVEIDPDYARAWALIAMAQRVLALTFGEPGDGGLAAADRAIALDGSLSEAHAAKASVLTRSGRYDEARAEIGIALALDPTSGDANETAASLSFLQRRFADAIGFWEAEARSSDALPYTVGLLIGCYTAIGDAQGARDAARRTLARCDKVLELEPANGTAMGLRARAFAALGEADRARDASERAFLVDPNNLEMRYYCSCTFAQLGALEMALDLFEQVTAKVSAEFVAWAKADPDLDPLRGQPRFAALIASAETRLARN